VPSDPPGERVSFRGVRDIARMPERGRLSFLQTAELPACFGGMLLPPVAPGKSLSPADGVGW